MPSGEGADVLFGSVPGGTQPSAITVTGSTNPASGSLWFDADSGINYTTHFNSGFDMGYGVANYGNLVTVISSGKKAVETNINHATGFSAEGGANNGFITNNSAGGLRFGAGVWLNYRSLLIAGSGATHFAGNFHAPGSSISTVNNGFTPQLILSGNNVNWGGTLNVGAETFVFLKSNLALGTGANIVASGGTLGFRSAVGSTLNYDYANTQTIQVSGAGAVRAWGTQPVGAIYHDGGNNTFTGNLLLNGHTRVGARGDAGGLTLSGQIWGHYWFTKVGPGLVTLTNPTNYWAGGTEIWAGVLRITNNTTIANAIHLKGGILELAYGTTHNLTLNKVQWSQDFGLYPHGGGFSAYGGNRTVTINNDATLTWGSGGMVANRRPLLLSSRYADSVITFTNPINLSSTNREIRVERGGINARAVLSGALSGTGGLIKTGPGLLELVSTSNTYTGPTRIREGALRRNSPSASNIQLDGGVLGLSTNFTANLGTAGGQIQWLGSGGFAAYGGDRHVTLNGGAELDQYQSHITKFIDHFSELRFGHYTATGTVIWNNPLNLSGSEYGTSGIYVTRGRSDNRSDVTFTKNIYFGYFGVLVVRGDGRTTFHNSNINPNRVFVDSAELRLARDGHVTNPSYGTSYFFLKEVTIQNGGTIVLDDLGSFGGSTDGWFYEDRIRDFEFKLDHGNIRYIGNNGNSNSIQTIGKLSRMVGANTIDIQNNTIGANTILKFKEIDDWGMAYTLNFTVNSGARIYYDSGGFGNDYKGILSHITINGADWAVGYYSSLGTFANYQTGSETLWNSHVKLSNQNITLSNSRYINSLILDGSKLKGLS